MVLYEQNSLKIKGNLHTLEQLYKRKVSGVLVKDMLNQAIDKIAVQETIAIVYQEIKLIVLRINNNEYFVVTCLLPNMYVKKGIRIIYI